MKLFAFSRPIWRTLPLVLSLAATPLVLVSAGCGRETGPAVVTPPTPTGIPKGMFANPIVERDAADPFMIRHDGWYYLSFTTGNEVELWQSRFLTDWTQARKKVVWRRQEKGPMSRDVWAPEVHWLDGKWYVYFTATSNDDPAQADQRRRTFVLESKTSDALGEYVERGQIKPTDADEYAIDGTVMTLGQKRYFLWSGRENPQKGAQNIYIAPMSNPYTINGPRVLLSTPEYEWEKKGWWVNEGPAPLIRNGRVFVAYSASGGTTPDYGLGLLTLTGKDPLKAANWRKSKVPVFNAVEGPNGNVYTVGHNSFTQSPDGREDWNIYHGKENKDNTWGGRIMRADKVLWRADGTPDFGTPTPRGVPIPRPSGEQKLLDKALLDSVTKTKPVEAK